MKPTTDNPHAWTAFCYAAGELSEDEQARFEDVLADDQQAREALAEAVELTQATAVALSPVIANPSTPSQHKSSQPRVARWYVWMSLGAAACLLLVVAWRGMQDGENLGDHAPPEVAEVDSDQQQALAARWNEVRQQDDLIDPFDGQLAVATDIEDWPVVDEFTESDAGPIAPAWMLAAASHLKDQGMMDDGANEPEMGIEPPQEQ